MPILEKQFAIDMNTTLTEIQENHHLFKTGYAHPDMRYWARNKGMIVCYENKLLCRTDNPELTENLRKTYEKCAGEWFGELENLKNLAQLLAEYDYQIVNYAPFFIPMDFGVQAIDTSCLHYYYDTEILQFKEDKRFKEAFCFDEQDEDKIGIAYIENDEIIGMVGANSTGKYMWEIGIELLENNTHRGIATLLVKEMTNKIYERNQGQILPVYSTQFTHGKSINVAIRAGYKIGWTEMMIARK